jgi:hypothetical protein
VVQSQRNREKTRRENYGICVLKESIKSGRVSQVEVRIAHIRSEVKLWLDLDKAKNAADAERKKIGNLTYFKGD